jgi:Fe-S-cluster containining protein
LDAEKKKGILEPQLPLELLSKYLRERTATYTSVPVPECTKCGVCCTFALIVPVTRQDSARLSLYCDLLLDDISEEIVIDRVLPRGDEGWCLHLQGTIGKEIGCRIYEDRPRVCHQFDAGSDRCHEYRRMYGLEPRLSDDETAAALERLHLRETPNLIEEVVFVERGQIERSEFDVRTGVSRTSNVPLIMMVAFLNDGATHELHTFEAGREDWFESDLHGLTLEQAGERIKEQAGW